MGQSGQPFLRSWQLSKDLQEEALTLCASERRRVCQQREQHECEVSVSVKNEGGE